MKHFSVTLLMWFTCFYAFNQTVQSTVDTTFKHNKSNTRVKIVTHAITVDTVWETTNWGFRIGVHAGIGAGLNYYYDDNDAYDSGTGPSFSEGITLGYHFKKVVGLLVEVNHNRMGYAVSLTKSSHTSPNPRHYYADMLQIPVLLDLRSKGSYAFGGYIGPTYNLLFNQGIGRGGSVTPNETRPHVGLKSASGLLFGFAFEGHLHPYIILNAGMRATFTFSDYERLQLYSGMIRLETLFCIPQKIKEKDRLLQQPKAKNGGS
ncbi:MAG: hypothetical protein U0V74_08860 [Chitinophagales bacterium]